MERELEPPTLLVSTPPMHALPDHYQVWQREDGSWWQLGRGNIFKATDRRTGETVALRFLAAGPRTPDSMGTLAEYAALLARPGSPLVAPLRDFFISGNFDVAATEFIPGDSLAERVCRDGPMRAAPVWAMAKQLLEALGSLHALGIAHGNLEPSKILFPAGMEPTKGLVLVESGFHPGADVAADPAVGSDATRQDLYRLGKTLWFALAGEALATPPGFPLPWDHLDDAGITPDLGALPVLLVRTLTGDPARCAPTAPAFMETLNVLESLRTAVPELRAMPGATSNPDPVAPTPKPRLPDVEGGELWTRPTRQLAAPTRRRRSPGQFWISLLSLAVGGAAGFFGGIAYEKNQQQQPETSGESSPPASLPLASLATPTPDPGVPLQPSPPVSAAAITARLERIKTLQPDVSNVLKYARELRRVATLPVTDAAAFPTNDEIAELLARFDWNDPASPNAHRTALLVVLGYSDDQPTDQGSTPSQQRADETAQALARSRITFPIYTCGMGDGAETPEVESAAAKNGQFVEVWVAFTLF